MRTILVFLLPLLTGITAAETASAQATVYDCVRFAENGNDVVVDNACVQRGLNAGANPNWINRDRKEPVSTLSRYVEMISLSRDPAVILEGLKAVRSLVDAGAKLQPSDGAILFWPISQGNTPLVQLLLSLGASATTWPKQELGTDLSPVEAAAARGSQSIVDLLVKHGATAPNPRDALQEQFVRAARYGTPLELADMLSRGASINGKTRDEETALTSSLWAIPISDCEALAKMRWLLANGADPNLAGKGIFGTGPVLHQAIWITAILYQSKKASDCTGQLLRELIKKGAHVAGRDSIGRTPLHIASARSNVQAVRLLLDSGSTVMPKDNAGRTPLDMAESGEVIRLLKQHGAKER